MESRFCRVLSDTAKYIMLSAVLGPWSAQEGQYRGTTGRSVNLSIWKTNVHIFMAILMFKGLYQTGNNWGADGQGDQEKDGWMICVTI